MKIQKFKKLAFLIVAASIATVAVSVHAQFADSSAGRAALRGNPVVDPRYLPPPPVVPAPIITSPVIQVIGAASMIDSSSAHVTATNCGFDEGTAQWMLSCGKRACEGFGYASGNVVEYFGGSVTLACYR